MRQPQAIDDFLKSLEAIHPRERAARVKKYTSRLFEKTMHRLSDGTIFVVTGDIPAMWIRDSTWQVLPLLQMNPDDEVAEIVASISKRQARFLKIDPYANAFNDSASGNCWHRDFPSQSPWVFERKFELDSWSTFLELAITLYEQVEYYDHLDENFWSVSAELLRLARAEQNHDPKSYRFFRENSPEADYLSHDGYGAPVAYTGLVWSGFRPSDDRCVYGYHIPANAHFAATLKRLAPVARRFGHAEIASEASALANEIREAVLVSAKPLGRFPYEIDGLGNALFMDDPNVPSLLALPKLGFCSNTDATYFATRNWLLSDNHEFFVSEFGFDGLASEHTPTNWIWPISMAIIGLTSTEDGLAIEMLEQLESSDGQTGNMHESFNPSNPAQFTRSWFSWADMTYVELVLASRHE